MMFFRQIKYRLVFLFVLFVILVLLISGLTLHWMIRQNLEAELGRKLISVANAASVQLGQQEIGYLIQGLGPRSHQRLQQRVVELKNKTDVKRIFFFDGSGRSLLDTEEQIEPGTPYNHLRFYQKEMEEIMQQRAVNTILFEGIDGQPTMTGYAPLTYQGRIVGGIGVDGNVPFLKAVNRMQTRLYLIGLIGTAAAILMGIALAASITKPIHSLVRVSQKIGEGDYTDQIPAERKDEIGNLASTMEEMRKGIIQREQELKAMLAGVAHEIRNPLAGIELFAGLLTDEIKSNNEAGEHLQKIVLEIDHLKEIINTFLSFARPQEPNRELCRIDEAVNEVRQNLTSQLDKKNITLSVESREQTWVNADYSHLKQIISNLIRNAIQAMTEGGRISIRWKMVNGRLSINFQDTGEGIPESVHDKIFTPFFTTREQGTGLGLTIVRNLLKINGGEITLIRSDKTGSEFCVTLESQTVKEDSLG